MLNKDHILVSEAVSLGISLSGTNDVRVVIPAVLGTFIGCQIPDIDTTKSKIGRWTRPLSMLIAHFGHRGFTHSLFGFIAFYAFVSLVLKNHVLGFLCGNLGDSWFIFLNWMILGYLLHLTEDWFSWSGICWFFPIKSLGHYRKWYPPMKRKDGLYYSHYYCVHHEPPIYVQTKIKKWFRYHSTDRGKKGRRIRAIRVFAWIAIIVEAVTVIV